MPWRREWTHLSNLARRIPWTEPLGELHSMGLQRVRQGWVTNTLSKGSPREIKMVEQSKTPLLLSPLPSPHAGGVCMWLWEYRLSFPLTHFREALESGRLGFQIRSCYLRVLVSPSVKREQWAFHMFLRVVKRIDWSHNKHEESGILPDRVWEHNEINK